MPRIRFIAALLVTPIFLLGALPAQYSDDSGLYLILSAQYGTARSHVDVTNRLKELARQDRSFRMGTKVPI